MFIIQTPSVTNTSINILCMFTSGSMINNLPRNHKTIKLLMTCTVIRNLRDFLVSGPKISMGKILDTSGTRDILYFAKVCVLKVGFTSK